MFHHPSVLSFRPFYHRFELFFCPAAFCTFVIAGFRTLSQQGPCTPSGVHSTLIGRILQRVEGKWRPRKSVFSTIWRQLTSRSLVRIVYLKNLLRFKASRRLSLISFTDRAIFGWFTNRLLLNTFPRMGLNVVIVASSSFKATKVVIIVLKSRAVSQH